MTATLTKPVIVPQYENGVINLYTPDPVTGAPTIDAPYTVNVSAILNSLFPGQGKIGAPNAVALHGNDLFFTNSSANSQAVIELPNYLNDPAAAIANAFVVTLYGNDYTGLAFDASGHLYNTGGSYGDNQIVRYTLPATPPAAGAAAGNNYTAQDFIGNAGSKSYFGDLTFDSSGNLWVADYENNRVVVFDAANLGGSNTWHEITNVAGSLAVANTTAGLTGSTAHLFAEPEGVAFDGTGASASLWIGNNNDGSSVTNTLTSLVKITKSLQDLILATPANTAVSAADIQANTNVFVYQVPNNADTSRPQFGGLQIDTTAGVLYANEEIGGDARAYTLASIAATPLDPSASLLPVTTTNPGNGGLALVTTPIPCFREGTHLEGEHGPVAVEALQPGMRLRTAGGALRETVWIGHSRVDCRRHPRPHDVLPVRVAAGAMGEGLPLCDLWLSPDHALFVHSHLVPVRYLINGATIVQEAAGSQENAGHVRYFHVELATHDILLAEGLPVESYLDTGNRGAFANGGAVAMAAPDFSRRVWDAAGCAPLCTGGAVVAAIRERLLAQAVRMGHTITPEPGLRLDIDRSGVAPLWFGQTAVFWLPPNAAQACLQSHRFRPADTMADSTDHRLLGVAVLGLRLDGAKIALDDPRLGAGWHAPEPGLRWTDGAASVACGDGKVLEVTLAPLGRYWQADPAARMAAA